MSLHPLEYETLRTLRGEALLPHGSRVVVGVSGGADSLALLLVLAALRPVLGLELTAVYGDHGLRPAEVAAESHLVAALAATLQVDFHRGVLPVRDHAREHGQSLEEAGRELRYRLLHQVAATLGGAVIAVAHHADDQAEEMLLRLIRGAGRAGLSGMAAQNGQGVIRPFLDVAKGRLIAYLRERRVVWREDSSNADPRYLRNRVRLELLPLLESRYNPAIRATLLRTGRILAAEDDLLGTLAGEFYRGLRQDGGSPGDLFLDGGRLAAGPVALQRRALELALLEVAAPVRFRYIEALRMLAAGSGGELHLPEGLRVSQEAGILHFSYPVGRVRRRGELRPQETPSLALKITAPGLWSLAPVEGQLLVELLAQPPSAAELTSGGGDYLDDATAPFPLLARNPRAGDRFHPLGAPGHRKVADFLGDRKLSRSAREKVVILESGGRIVALVGQRIDQACRVGEATRHVLKVSLVR